MQNLRQSRALCLLNWIDAAQFRTAHGTKTSKNCRSDLIPLEVSLLPGLRIIIIDEGPGTELLSISQLRILAGATFLKLHAPNLGAFITAFRNPASRTITAVPLPPKSKLFALCMMGSCNPAVFSPRQALKV